MSASAILLPPSTLQDVSTRLAASKIYFAPGGFCLFSQGLLMFVQLPLLFLQLLLLLPPHLFLSPGSLLCGSSQLLHGLILPHLALSLFTLQGRYGFLQ